MAKARHVCGWASALLPGLGSTLLRTAAHCCTLLHTTALCCTLLHTAAHYCTLLHTAARALVRTAPHFCQQTAYSFPSGAEGNLRGAIRCEQEPPKCAKKYFQVKCSNIKKIVPYSSFKPFVFFWGWLLYCVDWKRGESSMVEWLAEPHLVCR